MPLLLICLDLYNILEALFLQTFLKYPLILADISQDNSDKVIQLHLYDIPIDVKKLGIDMLSASAHKFNGPKGIGFLFHKKNIPLKPFHNGGSQEFEMRAGTENLAAIVGMAVALIILPNLIIIFLILIKFLQLS